MTFLHPIWLILLIPLAASLWAWKLPSRLLTAFRIISLLFIVLALSGLAVKLPSRTGTVIVIADRSRSMPPGSEASEKETIALIQKARQSDHQLAVISFGQKTAIELQPGSGQFGGFVNDVGGDASNLSEAVEKALSLIPKDTPAKILILSDGRWTGKDPSGVAARAAARGVSLDYRSLQRTSAGDVAISHIDAPGTATLGESFMMTAWVHLPTEQEVTFELRRGNQSLAANQRTLPAGLSRLIFRDTAGEPGTQNYSLKVVGAGQDPVPENNTAKLLIGVQGPRPLLCITPTPDSGFVRLLQAGGLNVKIALPAAFEWSLEELSKYSAVVIENAPADKIGGRGMETIAAWVSETGAGLMMTGGKNGYGPGGYFRSPLEPIMPVSMELRREHRKLALAIVVALDRSGSMAAPVGGGRTKMDLADLGTVQVLDLLSPMDEFGVVAVDSSSHIIANLDSVEKNKSARGAILSIDSGGGGIFVYEALSTAAAMLLKAQSGAKHIILFADAADSEEPGKYQELLAEARKTGVTVSVIGLGKPTDQDADLLRDIAHRGEGRIFFTENPEELPRLFAQDTFVVARSTFIDEPANIQMTGGLVSLSGRSFEKPPAIGGYNLCYIRPGANLAAISVDEYKAPVVAAWQAGIGRVLCYTGEADGEFTGAMAGWKDVGNFFTSLARWTAGQAENLPGNMLLTQEVKNGICLVQLHLDPEREADAFADLPRVTTLRGVAGQKPDVQKTKMHWTSADTLALEIPIQGSETALSTVEVTGAGKVTLPPVSLPYSPEFKPVDADEGVLTLERLAKATGGQERVDLSGMWNELPQRPRLIDLGPWLLLAALVVFLLEVLERRTKLLSAMDLKFQISDSRSAKPTPKTRPPTPRHPLPASAQQPVTPHTQSETPPAASRQPQLEDALRHARTRAKERTERDRH